MNCELCKKPILKYNPILNNLKIDEKCSVDICSECIEKFFKWQGRIYARLFPANAMKRRFGSKQK